METYLQHRDAYRENGEEESDTDNHAIPYAHGQESRHRVRVSPDCARGDAGKTRCWWRNLEEPFYRAVVSDDASSDAHRQLGENRVKEEKAVALNSRSTQAHMGLMAFLLAFLSRRPQLSNR
jgi:hypothetical protein